MMEKDSKLNLINSDSDKIKKTRRVLFGNYFINAKLIALDLIFVSK